MAASDHLSPGQFIDLFHGTRASRVPSIRQHGLEAPQNTIIPAQYRMLTSSRDEARAFTRHGDAAIVGYRVPRSAIASVDEPVTADHYLWPPIPGKAELGPGAGKEDTVHYAIKKPLPASMIHHVDILDTSEQEPHQRFYRPNQ